MKENTMHSDMLACYDAVLERLRGVEGVARVCEVGELSELLNHGKSRTAAPADGEVYVVFGGFRFGSTAGRGSFQQLELEFTFVLVESYYRRNRNPIREAGKTLTNILRAFNGFEPKNADGIHLTTQHFTAVNPPAIEYNDGFALFPLSFKTTVVIESA